MSVLAECHHDKQVSKHSHDDNDGEEDGEHNCLQRAQEFLLLFLLLLSRVYYVIQQTGKKVQKPLNVDVTDITYVTDLNEINIIHYN